MTVALEGVRATSVCMTPDHTVKWARANLPSRHGSLYVAPQCPAEVVDSVLHLDAVPGISSGQFSFINNGSLGAVYAHGEVAYKVYDAAKLDKIYRVSELAANIALSEGLRRVRQDPATPPLYHNGMRMDVTAPSYYAALVPEHPAKQTGTPSSFIIAMSLEHGFEPLPNEVPPAAVRLQYYQAAVQAVKLHPEYVAYDDSTRLTGEPRNILIGQTPGETAMTMTKIDVMAGRDFAALDLDLW